MPSSSTLKIDQQQQQTQTTLSSAIHAVLSSAAERICGLVERSVTVLLTEYEERRERSADVIGSMELQIQSQRRVLDELLRPRVTLTRAVIPETTASDSWNSARTQRLSSALSVLGRDCNARPGARKVSHSSTSSTSSTTTTSSSCSISSSSSSHGEHHVEGRRSTASTAEQRLQAARQRLQAALEVERRPPEPPAHVPSLRASDCKQYRGPGRPKKAGQMMMMMKKPCDRLDPIQTRKDAKLDTSAERTSYRSRRVGRPKSTPPAVSDASQHGCDSVRIHQQQPSCSDRGRFYTERLRRTERRPPADNSPSPPLTLRTSSRGKFRRPVGRPRKASSDAAPAGSRRLLPRRPSGVAAGKAAASNPFASDAGGNGNAVVKPSTLAALAARGWRGMKVGAAHRRRVRVRDHTVLHPSLLSLCHVTIKDIMERSMALAREAGWKTRKKWYPPPSPLFRHNRSRFTRVTRANKDTAPDASDHQDSETSSDTAMDRELHQHLQQMFEEDDNEEEFLGFSDVETSVQPDVEDRGSPGSNLTPTTMVSDISETTSASRDPGVLAKDSNAEPGGSKDSRSSSSSPAEVMMTAAPSSSPALSMDPGAQGELYSEAVHPPPALIIDFSILEKYSIMPGGSEETDLRSSSTRSGALFSEGLTLDTEKQQLPVESPSTSAQGELYSERLKRTLPTLPAESAVDIPSASFAHGAAFSCRDYGLPGSPRNSSPHYECLKIRGRQRETPAAAAAAERLSAPPVKRRRGVAVDGSNIDYFDFNDLGHSDSDEERTQAKVSMEAAAALAALSSSMDALQTHDSEDNQSSSNTDVLHLPVGKEVVSTERQQEPAPPPQRRGGRGQRQEEELAKSPEEEAHCSALTLPAATSEDYNDNSWTEPLSSTSSETQDATESPPTGGEGQPLRLRCSESDSDEWEETRDGETSSSTGRGSKTRAEVEADGASSRGAESEDGGSEWEETRKAPAALKSRRRGRPKQKGQRLSLSVAQRQSLSMMRFRGKTTCTVCGKRFREKHSLIKHKRIHSEAGEGPFSCPICCASFNQKELLRKHMATGHPGDNPFECTVCDRVFGQKRALDLHMRTHAAFSCTFCNKRFDRKFALVGHMTTHTAKKTQRKRL